MTSLYTAFLLLLWLRIVPVPREEAIGNPLVSVPLNQADRLCDLIRPAFGRRATRPFAAFVLLVLAVALRGAAASVAQTPWILQVGPAVFVPNVQSPRECVLFSALVFGWTIQRLWMFTLFFGWLRRRRKQDMNDGLALSLSLPVSAAPRWMHLLFVLLLGVVLGHATIHAGVSVSLTSMAEMIPEGSSFPRQVFDVVASVFPDFRATTPLALALMAAGTFSEVFSVSADVVVAMIGAAVIGLIFRMPFWVAFGNAGLEYVVGSFFRNPMKWGGMSFAPLVYLILAGLLYFVVSNILTALVLAFSGAITPEVLAALRQAMEVAR